jgi:hypothetical protein
MKPVFAGIAVVMTKFFYTCMKILRIFPFYSKNKSFVYGSIKSY